MKIVRVRLFPDARQQAALRRAASNQIAGDSGDGTSHRGATSGQAPAANGMRAVDRWGGGEYL